MATPPPRLPRAQRKSRKAPAIKADVITRRVQGQSKRKIAKDLGITFPTVQTILDESHIDAHLKSGQELSVSLIPEALRVMKVRLAGNSENAAIKTLENTIWPLDRNTTGKGLGNDTLLQVAITNLIQPATTNSVQALNQSNETTLNSEVVDITTVSTS